MFRVLIGSTSALAVVAAIAMPAFAADPAADAAAKRRCNELIAFYDRWATTKTPDHSDGARNHNRMSAEFDCQRGNYEAGIARIEAQIRNRVGMEPPVDVGEGPMFFPDGDRGPSQALKPR